MALVTPPTTEQAARDAAARRALRVTTPAPRPAPTPSPVTVERSRPELDAKRQELAARAEELDAQTAKNEAFRLVVVREFQDGKSTRKSYESGLRAYANRAERIAVNRARLDRDNRALGRAEREGLSYGAARTVEKKKAARSDVSTEQQLAELAAAGDQEAAAKLQAKKRSRARGEFSTRVIPKYDGPTVGKTSGVYRSPLSGKAVLVREGGATSLPKGAQARFTYNPYKPADNFRNRNYTVYARVGEEQYLPKSSTSSPASPPTEVFPDAGLYLPPGEYGTNISVAPTGTTTNFLPKGSGKAVLREVAPPKETSKYWYDRGKNIMFSDSDTPGQTAKKFVGKGLSYSLSFGTGVYELIEPIDEPLQRGDLKGAGAGAVELAAGPVIFAAELATDPKGTTKGFIQQFGENPTGTIGQLTPAAIEGFRFARAKSRAAAATEATAGKVAGPEVAEAIKDVPSTRLRVEQLDAVDVVQLSQEQGGAGIQFTRTQPKLGDVSYLTPEEIPLVANYDVFVSGSETTRIRPNTGGRQPGVSAEVGGSVTQPVKGVARATPEQVGLFTEPTYTSSFYYADTPTRAIVESVGVTRLNFVEGSRAVGPVRQGAGASSSVTNPLRLENSPYRVDYRPSIDYWQQILVETPEAVLYQRVSYATGESQVGVMKLPKNRGPQVVRAVETTTKPAAPAPAGSSGATSSFVDVPQKDGTVLRQKVEFAQPAETTTKAVSTTSESTGAQTTKGRSRTTESIYANTDAYAVRYPVDAADFYTGTTSGGKSSNVQKVYFGGVLSPAPIIGSDSLTGTTGGQKQGQRPKQDQDAAVTVFPAIDQVVSPIVDVTPRQATDTATQPVFDLIRPVTPPPRTPGRGGPKEPVTPLPPRPRGRDGKKKALFPSFSVEVRQKGQFRTVGTGLSLSKAAQRGASIVGATTAASFRLTPESGDKKPLFGDVRSSLPFGRFRPSKRDAGVIVERRGFRISSAGEKTGLRRAKRKKGLFGGFQNGIFK